MRGRARARPNTVVLVVGAAIDRRDVPDLCERVRALVAGSGADVLICDVGALAQRDAVAVDALARMLLTARRLGCPMGLHNAGAELRDLLRFFGLDEVLLPCDDLFGVWTQPEQREQPRGLEEVVEPDDPAV